MYPNDVQPDDEERLEAESQDFDRPAMPPANDHQEGALGSTHPAQDTDLDSTEVNDIGMDAASGVTPPSESDVVGYQESETEE